MGMHSNSVLWNIREGFLKAKYDGYRYLITESDYENWKEKYYD